MMRRRELLMQMANIGNWKYKQITVTTNLTTALQIKDLILTNVPNIKVGFIYNNSIDDIIDNPPADRTFLSGTILDTFSFSTYQRRYSSSVPIQALVSNPNSDTWTTSYSCYLYANDTIDIIYKEE